MDDCQSCTESVILLISERYIKNIPQGKGEESTSVRGDAYKLENGEGAKQATKKHFAMDKRYNEKQINSGNI